MEKVCPRCKLPQEGINECEYCGLKFSKYAYKKKWESFPKDSNIKSEVDLYAKGINGQIELYSNKVCIRRKGVDSFLTHGFKGDKDIMISSITSIQFKEAPLMTRGYIQFAFMGGQEAKRGIFEGIWDENTVIFNHKQQFAFERIRDEVEKRIQSANNPNSKSSDADELAKFANLRDKGIITEEEFQQKKKQILGF